MPITYDDFAKVELKVATILEARAHPNGDRLLVLKVDVGEPEPRQICAGIRAYYAPETLVGRQVILVANLEPRVLRGEVSNGMLLAATDGSTGKIVILQPAEPVAPGSGVK
jgi:methionine--tRNA ligase beta chain